MPPSYEPLPSNDSDQNIAQPVPTKRTSFKRNLSFLILGLLATAFIFYKAGQWSVSAPPQQTSDVKDTENSSHPNEGIDLKENGTTGIEPVTDMPGKYSVG